MKSRLVGSILLALFMCVSGCARHIYRDSKAGVAQTNSQIKSVNAQAKSVAPPVVIRSDYYVDTRPISLLHEPAWLHDEVRVRTRGLPLGQLMNRILQSHPVSVSYDNTVDLSRAVTMNFKGTIKGALKVLSNSLDYHYLMSDKNQLTWSAFEDRTFDISFMPGASNYLVGQQSGVSREGHQMQKGASPVNQLNDQQYSNLSAKLSVWSDLTHGLMQLKSADGRVVVSESTTSVSVHDHPRQVRAMAHFIKKFNRNLSKQVLIRVQVLEVELKKDFNFGIDWNVLAHALGRNFNLTGSLADAANITQNSFILSSTSTTSGSLAIGTKTQTFIKSLGEQGRVRVVTEPQVITMNNQMGSIRITKNVGYIESVSQTQSEQFSTVSVTPGTITDGFTLYVLPKIQGDKVILQVSSTIAHLDRLEKMSTQPTDSTSTSTTSPDYQAIQLPTLSQKAFNQRSFIRTGSTLIMAGYKRLEDQTKDASMFGVPQLGGKGAMTNHIETLILITPTILENPTSHVHIDS